METTPIPTSTPQSVPPQAPPAQRGIFLPVLITFLLTALAVGGGFYVWQTYFATPEPLVQPVVSMNDNETKELEDQIAILQGKLLASDFKAWAAEHDVRYYVQDPNNSQKFYYIVSDSNQTIYVYDNSKDTIYKSTGEITPRDANKELYKEALPADSELRIADIIQNKLVFYSTLKDDSPGPCMDPFLTVYTLTALDLTVDSPTKQPYVLPESLAGQRLAARTACEAKL